jgi:predicted Zn-dependent protease
VPIHLAPIVLGFLILMPGQPAHAHGDDLFLIEALTEELEKAPEPDLYIRRGELFRHHQEWALAEADFIAAAKLEPKLAVVDFFRARLLLESGFPEKAHPIVDRYISAVPDEAEGWFLRGEVLAALGRHDDGAADYSEGISRARTPRPDHYLRRARFLGAAPKPDPARIIAALDEGIARLGPIISLVELTILFEEARNNFDGALERIALAMAHSPRRERWLVRQGDVLVQAGRPDEAIASYRAALAAIEALPERYRTTVPIEKLVRDAQEALERLSDSQESP